MSQGNSVIAAILGDQVVAYHPILAKALRSVTAALFLSQLLYWHNVMERSKDRKGEAWDGWFYKVADEITDETGMTRKEQTTARRILKHAGLIEEKRVGVPARLWFRIDIAKLDEFITSFTQKGNQDFTNGQIKTSPTGKSSFDQRANQDFPNGQIMHDTTQESNHKTTQETTAAPADENAQDEGDLPADNQPAAADLVDFCAGISITDKIAVSRIGQAIAKHSLTLNDLDGLWSEIAQRDNVRNPQGLFIHALESGQRPQVTGQQLTWADLLPSAPVADDDEPPEPADPAQETWRAVLQQLQFQTDRSAFETWLKPTTVVSVAGDLWMIAAPNTYARDWLTNRLADLVTRVLGSVVGEPCRVEFQFDGGGI